MKFKQTPFWHVQVYKVLIIALVMILFQILVIPGAVGFAGNRHTTAFKADSKLSRQDDLSLGIISEMIDTEMQSGSDSVITGDPYSGADRNWWENVQGELCQTEDLSLCTDLAPIPDWMAEGNQTEAWFGWSVASAGDVNGDDISDVIVGAYLYDNAEINSGKVFVFHGSSEGLSNTPAWTAVGDQVDAHFGRSVGTAGDVNNDGYSDVIVGAPFYDNGEADEGRAYVYYGSSTGLKITPGWIVESNQAGAEFGRVVATAGDVNGDGFSDVIIGAHYYDNGQLDEGAAFVYYGSSSGLSDIPDWSLEGNQQEAEFGRSVSSAGDVNGDGYSDIIIGAPAYDSDQGDEGRVFVYYGSAGGLRTSAEWMMSGSDVVGFGWSVGSAGDVNGDGYDDIIVGAPYYGVSQPVEGRAFVYYGSDAGLSPSHDWFIEGNQPSANLGWSVGTAGDFNNDGYSDVMVGAPVYDNLHLNEGRMFIFPGNQCGLREDPMLIRDGGQDYAWLGISVGSTGDVNNDDYGDVIVGAPLYNNGEEDEGSAYGFLGRLTGQNSSPRADAGEDQVVLRNETITLDGSGSSDPECYYPLNYLWVQTGGPEVTLSDPTVVTPTFTILTDPSVLTFTLTVTNTLGFADPTPDDVAIVVMNLPPVADAGTDQIVETGDVVTLDGSGSSDPDNDYPLSYLWVQTQGPEVTLSDPTSVSPTFTAPSDPAVLMFTLTVVDNLGLECSVSDEVMIMIGGALGYEAFLPITAR